MSDALAHVSRAGLSSSSVSKVNMVSCCLTSQLCVLLCYSNDTNVVQMRNIIRRHVLFDANALFLFVSTMNRHVIDLTAAQ